MKFGTDLTSMAAIGLGTAIAIGGSGMLLFAAGSSHGDVSSSCITVRSLAPEAVVSVSEARSDLSSELAIVERGVTRIETVIGPDVQLRAECVDAEVRVDVREIREQALEAAEAARARADEARVQAGSVRERADLLRLRSDELRVRVEEIRTEARAGGEVDAAQIEALVAEVLREAGLQRDARGGGGN